jgi:catechol 2,3-dioxygenase-like lactoylglutathione lyase family enzyme
VYIDEVKEKTMLKYSGVLLVVSDIARSKEFYRDIFGLTVTTDDEVYVVFDGGISLQAASTWQGYTGLPAATPNGTTEIYFETDDIDAVVKELGKRDDIKYLNPLKMHPWGQRALRIYDPDGHIVEIGEQM